MGNKQLKYLRAQSTNLNVNGQFLEEATNEKQRFTMGGQ